MELIINTPYRYTRRSCGFVNEPYVEVPYSDTSVDNSQKQAVSSGSDLTKGIYTNSNSPVKVFGDSILASMWNPFTSHGNPLAESGVNVSADASVAAQASTSAAASIVES